MEKVSRILVAAMILQLVTSSEVTADGNETAFSNESALWNETAYKCAGASKEELKLYSTLSWWMDAVFQVGEMS